MTLTEKMIELTELWEDVKDNVDVAKLADFRDEIASWVRKATKTIDSWLRTFATFLVIVLIAMFAFAAIPPAFNATGEVTRPGGQVLAPFLAALVILVAAFLLIRLLSIKTAVISAAPEMINKLAGKSILPTIAQALTWVAVGGVVYCIIGSYLYLVPVYNDPMLLLILFLAALACVILYMIRWWKPLMLGLFILGIAFTAVFFLGGRNKAVGTISEKASVLSGKIGSIGGEKKPALTAKGFSSKTYEGSEKPIDMRGFKGAEFVETLDDEGYHENLLMPTDPIWAKWRYQFEGTGSAETCWYAFQQPKTDGTGPIGCYETPAPNFNGMTEMRLQGKKGVRIRFISLVSPKQDAKPTETSSTPPTPSTPQTPAETTAQPVVNPETCRQGHYDELTDKKAEDITVYLQPKCMVAFTVPDWFGPWTMVWVPAKDLAAPIKDENRWVAYRQKNMPLVVVQKDNAKTNGLEGTDPQDRKIEFEGDQGDAIRIVKLKKK